MAVIVTGGAGAIGGARPVAARRELGFVARTGLEQGLASTIAWTRTVDAAAALAAAAG